MWDIQMTEINQKESQVHEGAAVETKSPETEGPGVFLRKEREKKGLSQDQIAEMTKLRRHMVDALEREDWDKLPPPVFVKGFIRSYAKALGLDEIEVLDLYEEAATLESEKPEPLLEPRKTGKRPYGLFLFIAVVLAGVLLVLWKDFGPEEKAASTPASTQEEETVAVPIRPAEPPVLEEPAKEMPMEETRPDGQSVNPPPFVASVEKEPGEARPAERSQGEEESPVQEVTSIDAVTGPAEAIKWHVLKGIVEGRTWMSVRIDDQEAKEYIFQPGSRPQWKARKGFHIVVGNAAGIEFEFDGQKIGDLGELGQVVRLKLPEGYESPEGED
jgi:cytoskeleton protein RodZ